MKTFCLRLTLLLGCCGLLACGSQRPASAALDARLTAHPDYPAVRSAIANYVDALYLADSNRIVASVDPTLRKVGYWYNAGESSYRNNLEMSYRQLVDLAAGWNASGENADADSPREIVIFDINDKSASGKLTAVWGVDYFHLAKVDGTWKIMNVLWQSPPRVPKGGRTAFSRGAE